ncbi:MAG: protoporphyrinogen oxidase [Bacteroidales bacterium]|nr:protoporphyrinogen oxidase [Bacteroidales bacterium]
MEQKKQIVIIGAGLTGLSLAWYLKKYGHTALVIEKTHTPGGVMQTVSEGGFVYETGPNTGVIGTPDLVDLLGGLSGSCTPERASRRGVKRYIMYKERWHALPCGPVSGLFTPLFSMRDKFRILGEPFRKPGTDPYESVADMTVRRMGRTILNYAVNPFISGIYAGDPAKLTTQYALPKLYALEQNYGSFIKGAIRKARLPKTDEEKQVTREIFSAEGGFGNLTSALVEKTGAENIVCSAQNVCVEPAGKRYTVSYTVNGQKTSVDAHTVVSTTGSHEIAGLFPFIPKAEITPATSVEYAKLVQVAVGYNKWTGFKLDAFGGLVPAREQRSMLGILFPSAIFKGRAPEGGALLSVFMGGVQKPEVLEYTDNEIEKLVYYEIESSLYPGQAPDLVRITRHSHAIPQYGPNTGRRLDAIAIIEQRYPGIYLAGNGRDGIAMADRVKQARTLAGKINSDI